MNMLKGVVKEIFYTNEDFVNIGCGKLIYLMKIENV